MSPTLGRIVHYHTHLGITVAAIVTQVLDNETINLTMFAPMGATEGRLSVKQGDEPGCWNWPPRV